MPAPTPTALSEIIGIINKGMNSGVVPRLVEHGQLAFAINITNRGALPRTRPVWRKVPLKYPADSSLPPGQPSTKTGATSGLFQDAHFYQSYGTTENVLVSSISGRLFRYLVGSFNMVQEVSLQKDLNDPTADQAWMWQSEDFLIVQARWPLPLFFDGAQVRRSKGPAGAELPAGMMGAYVQGRNWMVRPDGQSFIAGDLVYSHGFGDGYNGRSAVLGTEENLFISGGGAFAVPITAGEITAMLPIAIPDTSLGQGPLMVTTRSSVYNVSVPFERTAWADVQYPIMSVGLPNYGSVSQCSAVPVNGDAWYRSQDGIRSYSIARRDFNTWVNTPLSVEMEKVLMIDSDELLRFASAVIFDNRYLVTCQPNRTPRGTAHKGLVALDFNNISNLTTRSSPAYDGLWTGLNILKILKGTFHGRERCFAFALDKDGLICLYELMEDGRGKFDNNGVNDIGVESSMESRSFGFTKLGSLGGAIDQSNTLKKLYTGDLFLDKLSGLVNFTVKYKSDEHPVWQDWQDFDVCALASQCATNNCLLFQDARDSYRTFRRLKQPDDFCNEITSRPMRTGYEFQVRLAWKGYAQLNRFIVWGVPIMESPVDICPPTTTCVLLAGCDLPWFDYQIEK